MQTISALSLGVTNTNGIMFTATAALNTTQFLAGISICCGSDSSLTVSSHFANISPANISVYFFQIKTR